MADSIILLFVLVIIILRSKEVSNILKEKVAVAEEGAKE